MCDLQVIDLSVGIEDGMPYYPGDPVPSVEQFKTVEHDGHALKKLCIGTHTGTHIDAPAHFIAGAETVDRLPPLVASGPAIVLDLSQDLKEGVVDADIPPAGDKRVLLIYTGTNLQWRKGWDMGMVARISVGLANKIVDAGYHAVGIDSPTIGHSDVHTKLLGNKVVIIENLSSTNLRGIVGKTAEFLCIPVLVKDGDGSPARAVCMFE